MAHSGGLTPPTPRVRTHSLRRPCSPPTAAVAARHHRGAAGRVLHRAESLGAVRGASEWSLKDLKLLDDNVF